MKKRDILTLQQAFERAGMVNAGPKFTYWVASNKRKLKPIVESLQEANKLPPDAMAYEEARAELARSLADPTGPNPMTTGGMVRITDRAAYDVGVSRLRAQFPRAQSLIEEHTGRYEAMLDEELSEDDRPKLTKISIEHLPADLTGNVVDVLFDWIE